MKKILLVIPTLGVGGAEKLVIDITKNMDRTQYRPIVLVYYKQNLHFKKDLDNTNIETIFLDKKIGLDLHFFSKVRKTINKLNPDVIHAHVDTLLYLIPSLFKVKRKLFTVHNIAEEEAKGLNIFIRKFCFKFAGVEPIGLSPTISKSIEKLYNIPHVNYVYNGVDTSRYYKNVEHRKSKINLIAVGTLKSQKNYPMMIEVINILKNSRNDFHLYILGDGLEKEKIISNIETLRLNDYITLQGTVDNVEYYLSQADIFISSSLYEGIPLSILEAFSSGLPVVSTRAGGTIDLIEEGYNGYTCDINDINAMVKNIEKLMDNKNLLVEMSLNAKKTSIKYDISETVKEYEKLYENF